jgi:Flp pilus assembly protein TadD
LEGRDFDRALGHLKKALTIQPHNGYFLDSLGWIYFKKGDSEKALVQIQKALIYTDPDPVLYDHLGDILFSLKIYDEATGAWKNSHTLTLNNKDDLGGEMPNPQTLQDKIEKAKKLIQQSY